MKIALYAGRHGFTLTVGLRGFSFQGLGIDVIAERRAHPARAGYVTATYPDGAKNFEAWFGRLWVSIDCRWTARSRREAPAA
jgi:hypothetical protein